MECLVKVKDYISIVIPIYNESELIAEWCRVIPAILGENEQEYEYEVIFVDDGSTDNSWKMINLLGSKYKWIKGISFSRNFGKDAAIVAGLAYSRGDCVITLDADFQHPPEKIPEFIKCWHDGTKIVEGVKNDRGKEGVLHKYLAKMFYMLMSKAIGRVMDNTSDYKLLDREIVEIILKMPEKQMFYRAITSWIGFKTDVVKYDVRERKKGKSKWSAFKLLMYAIRNTTSFSSAPLQIATCLGIVFFFFSLVVGTFTLLKWLTGGAVQGFTTVILLQLIIGSMTMIVLGLIGYYIAQICESVRSRPRFIVKEEVGYDR